MAENIIKLMSNEGTVVEFDERILAESDWLGVLPDPYVEVPLHDFEIDTEALETIKRIFETMNYEFPKPQYKILFQGAPLYEGEGKEELLGFLGSIDAEILLKTLNASYKMMINRLVDMLCLFIAFQWKDWGIDTLSTKLGVQDMEFETLDKWTFIENPWLKEEPQHHKLWKSESEQ